MKYLKYYISTITILSAGYICTLGKFFPLLYFISFSSFIIFGDLLLKDDNKIHNYKNNLFLKRFRKSLWGKDMSAQMVVARDREHHFAKCCNVVASVEKETKLVPTVQDICVGGCKTRGLKGISEDGVGDEVFKQEHQGHNHNSCAKTASKRAKCRPLASR